MSTPSSWNIGFSGNWNVGANWSAGAPDDNTDAGITAPGTYTVTLSSAGAANTLVLNAAGATLNETAAGSLMLGEGFEMTGGTAILNGANTIFGTLAQTGGLLEAGNANALGSAAYTLGGGELLGTATETLASSNSMTFEDDVTLAAAHGTTLALNPTALNFDATSAPLDLVVGQGGNNGVIVLGATASFGATHGIEFDVQAGTLRVGTSNSSVAAVFGSSTVNVAAGATLDLNGNGTTLSTLSGAGTVTSADGEAIEVAGGTFGGAITGDAELVVVGPVILTGANTYTAETNISSGDSLQLGNGGTTGSITGDITNSGTLIYDHSNGFTQTAGITGGGAVTYEGGGTVTINRSEIYSGATLATGVTISTNTSSSLGIGQLTLDNSSLLTTTGLAVANSDTTVEGNVTLAAAHGTTLTIDEQSLELGVNNDEPTLLTIGQAGNDGTVVLGATNSAGADNAESVDVAAGTLQITGLMAGESTSLVIKVEAGATLDLNGLSAGAKNLTGDGSVINHGGAETKIISGDFGGVISGDTALHVVSLFQSAGGLALAGANTYSGGTTIDQGATLSLGDGGTTGSVTGDIVDDGALYINRSNTFTETAAVSGAGVLTQIGTGTTIIDRAETYSGGTNVLGGVLSIDRATALGSGRLALFGGEFLATGTFAPTNALTVTSHSTIAATTGTTLTLNSTAGWTLNAQASGSLTFGDSSHAGTVVWDTPAGSTVNSVGKSTVAVNDGTLKAGVSSLDFLLENVASTTVGAGGTLDIAGFDTVISDLLGSGKIVNSAATEATLSDSGGNFSGQIDGAITLAVFDNPVTLSGANNFTGGIELGTGAVLNFTGSAFTQSVTFGGGATLNITSAAGATETFIVTSSATGIDAITGGAGTEIFALPTLTAVDHINGGTGTALDEIKLTAAGTISSGALGNVSHIEELVLANGTNHVTLTDALVTSADDGHILTLVGGTGADTINATAVTTASDYVNYHLGSGNDVVGGGQETDTFVFAPSDLTGGDTISGGTGSAVDAIHFSTAGTIAASAFANVSHIEELVLANGTNSVSLNNAMVTSADDGHKLTVLGGTGSDTINASAVTTTTDAVSFHGGAGGDVMTASAGTDTFVYGAASESSSTNYDTISGMNFGVDRFDIPGAPGLITGFNNAVTTGTLDAGASFDSELHTALSGHLSAHHAILFVPNAGTLHGQEFLVVDLNGNAQYDPNTDIVIHLTASTGSLTTGDFV